MTVVKQQQDSRLNKNAKSNRNSSVTSCSSTTVTTTTKVLGGNENDPEITDITEEFNNSDQIDNKSAKKKITNNFESTRKRFSQDSMCSSRGKNRYEKIERSPKSTSRSSLVRGDSIKALQHKFQQPTVSSSFKQNKSAKSESRITISVRQTKVKTVITKLNSSKTDGSSFLHNNSRATGEQDVLTSMRNSDLVVETGDTSEDIEARALPKFLGESVILQGMEQGGKSPISNQTATKSSASFVHQVETQVAQLESCPNYDQIRTRLRQIMADQKEQGNWSNWSNQFDRIKARFERGTQLTTEMQPNKKNVVKSPSKNSIPCRSKEITSFKPVETAQKPTAPGPLPLQSGVREFWHQMVMGQRKAAPRSTAAGASVAVGKLQRPMDGSVTPYEGYLTKEEIADLSSPFRLNEDMDKVDETFEILFKETFKS